MLTLGFLAASVSYSSWTAQRTILDPSATRVASQAPARTPSVQSTLAKQIRRSLLPALGPPRSTKKLKVAIDAAVADPKFVGAYRRRDREHSAERVRRRERRSHVTLDSQAVTGAINKALTQVEPKLAANAEKVRGECARRRARRSPTSMGPTPRSRSWVASRSRSPSRSWAARSSSCTTARCSAARAGAWPSSPSRPTLVFALLPRLLGSLHNPSLKVGSAMLGRSATGCCSRQRSSRSPAPACS